MEAEKEKPDVEKQWDELQSRLWKIRRDCYRDKASFPESFEVSHAEKQLAMMFSPPNFSEADMKEGIVRVFNIPLVVVSYE